MKPPRLVVRTMALTFVTAAVLLGVVFTAVIVTVRRQVRETVRAHLEATQQMFASLETRERQAARLQAETIAENPTLKAAIDTYAAEFLTGDALIQDQLRNTITVETVKMASRVDADAIVVVDARHRALAAAGPQEAAWLTGAPIPAVVDPQGFNASEGMVRVGTGLFRIAAAPLVLEDGAFLGSLYVATSVDQRLAEQLSRLARSETVIVSRGQVVASTLSTEALASFTMELSRLDADDGIMDLGGESFAFRRLARLGDTSFYALASVDASARAAMREITASLAAIALGGGCLALLGSVWVSRRLSAPLGALSGSLHHMATTRQFTARLPLTGSSLEFDQLTDTCNALMASVAAAETETEVAYTSAIRALAAALDARDPYTAGHSERVSAIAVAIGRAMDLPSDELEVIRLGALLHDIGKIGVPDEILRKPGPLTAAERDIIEQHPGLGARILRTVPFLAPHIPIVELHHERPDGRGYPYGLMGDAIPLAAHIVHVADAYDAMTGARAYRRGRPASEALRELWSCAGTDFHAEVVAALANALHGLTSSAEEPVREAVVA